MSRHQLIIEVVVSLPEDLIKQADLISAIGPHMADLEAPLANIVGGENVTFAVRVVRRHGPPAVVRISDKDTAS